MSQGGATGWGITGMGGVENDPLSPECSIKKIAYDGTLGCGRTD